MARGPPTRRPGGLPRRWKRRNTRCACLEAKSNTVLAEALQSELKLYQAGSPLHSPEQTP